MFRSIVKRMGLVGNRPRRRSLPSYKPALEALEPRLCPAPAAKAARILINAPTVTVSGDTVDVDVVFYSNVNAVYRYVNLDSWGDDSNDTQRAPPTGQSAQPGGSNVYEFKHEYINKMGSPYEATIKVSVVQGVRGAGHNGSLIIPLTTPATAPIEVDPPPESQALGAGSSQELALPAERIQPALSSGATLLLAMDPPASHSSAVSVVPSNGSQGHRPGNLGEANALVQFLSHGNGPAWFSTSDSSVPGLSKPRAAPASGILPFDGASAAVPAVGFDPWRGIAEAYLGGEPGQWPEEPDLAFSGLSTPGTGLESYPPFPS